MIERRSRRAFALKPPYAFFVPREAHRQEFERYFAVEGRVLGEVNLAHSAGGR